MTLSTPSNKPTRGTWIRWLILPLLLGAATMVLISRTDKQEMEIAIAVTVNKISDDLLLMDVPRQSVKLLVSGSPSALETIDSKETTYRLDLSGLGEGTHTRPGSSGRTSACPKGFPSRALLTPSLTIRLEPVSQKTVGVIAVLEGNPAPGFAVAAVILKPDHIVLKGTTTMLAGIDTVKTRPINLEALRNPSKKRSP